MDQPTSDAAIAVEAERKLKEKMKVTVDVPDEFALQLQERLHAKAAQHLILDGEINTHKAADSAQIGTAASIAAGAAAAAGASKLLGKSPATGAVIGAGVGIVMNLMRGAMSMMRIMKVEQAPENRAAAAEHRQMVQMARQMVAESQNLPPLEIPPGMQEQLHGERHEAVDMNVQTGAVAPAVPAQSNDKLSERDAQGAIIQAELQGRAIRETAKAMEKEASHGAMPEVHESAAHNNQSNVTADSVGDKSLPTHIQKVLNNRTGAVPSVAAPAESHAAQAEQDAAAAQEAVQAL